VIPERLDQVWGKVQDMERLRLSYMKNAAKQYPLESWNAEDIQFLAEDVKVSTDWVHQQMAVLPVSGETG
jgi:2-amino-4-ketopentanoate thiolase beta subunit